MWHSHRYFSSKKENLYSVNELFFVHSEAGWNDTVSVQGHENRVQNIIMCGEIQRQLLFQDLLKLMEFLQFALELFSDHTLFALLFNNPAFY